MVQLSYLQLVLPFALDGKLARVYNTSFASVPGVMVQIPKPGWDTIRLTINGRKGVATSLSNTGSD